MAENEDQEPVGEVQGETQGETQTDPGVAQSDDEAGGETPTDPVVEQPDAATQAEPCVKCAALRAELELKTHLIDRLEDALGQASFDIVVDNSGAVIGPNSFEPGHKLAEVRCCEDCVSVQWLVDAVRGGRARVVKSAG